MTNVDMSGERELTTVLLLSATEVAAIDTIGLSSHRPRSQVATDVLNNYIDTTKRVNESRSEVAAMYRRNLVPGDAGSSDEDIIDVWSLTVGNLPGATPARLELSKEEIDPFMYVWAKNGGTGNVDDAFRWALYMYLFSGGIQKPPQELGELRSV